MDSTADAPAPGTPTASGPRADGSGPRTQDGSRPRTPDGNGPRTQDGSRPRPPGRNGPRTPGGNGPLTEDGNGPRTEDGSRPRTPDGNGPRTEDGNGPRTEGDGRPTERDVRAVWAAARTLPPWARGEAAAPEGGALCHGDLHLGQLVRHPAPDGAWLLIDVDDLGLGTPAWDLARPAAWYAAGLLDTATWLRFLDAYRSAGGPAAGPPGSDPWPELDLAARALTVQTAALAVAKAAERDRRLEDVERLMVDACARMAALPPDLESMPPS
ncbi:phosphotransferase family protein [Streptomyces sp. NPDC058662]|uniref:phosphotransferase family protein n=1 Tax=Streptomyces sp. NPDC058662 TaxID=3346583 RepID=UPI0036558D5F